MNDELKKSVDELRNSINKLNRRFNSWWKFVWYGMLQGAGALAGATLLVILISYTLDALGLLPFVGGRVEEMRSFLNEFRPK